MIRNPYSGSKLARESSPFQSMSHHTRSPLTQVWSIQPTECLSLLCLVVLNMSFPYLMIQEYKPRLVQALDIFRVIETTYLAIIKIQHEKDLVDERTAASRKMHPAQALFFVELVLPGPNNCQIYKQLADGSQDRRVRAAVTRTTR